MARKKYQKIRQAYINHYRRSVKRGIEFQFSFDDWVAWWEEHLGPDWLWMRGSYGNQYVMARYYDDGPYAAHNVKCITASKNCAEIAKNIKIKGKMRKRYARLPERGYHRPYEVGRIWRLG